MLNIIWIFLKKGIVVNIIYNLSNSFLKLLLVKCFDYGEYRVVVLNGIGRFLLNMIKIVVNCKCF